MKHFTISSHPFIYRVSLGASAAALTLSFAACDVKKTEDGKAPSVQVDPGKMPKYEVDTAKVTTSTEQKEVTVPKVTTETKTITVPKVNVTMPGEATPTPAPTATP